MMAWACSPGIVDWMADIRSFASVEWPKCVAILRQMLTASSIARWLSRPALMHSCSVWAGQPTERTPASSSPFDMFLALSRRTLWTSFSRFHYNSISRSLPQMLAAVCEPGRWLVWRIANRCSHWSFIQCAVKLISDSELSVVIYMSVARLTTCTCPMATDTRLH